MPGSSPKKKIKTIGKWRYQPINTRYGKCEMCYEKKNCPRNKLCPQVTYNNYG